MSTDHSVSLTGRALSAVGVRESERTMVGWVAGLFLVTQMSHGLGANAADTLFFSRFGVERLPTMIVLAGGAVMLAVLVHAMGLTSRGERSWLPIITAVSALWVLGEWAAVFFDRRAIYAVVWVSTQAIVMLTFTMMWNAAGAAVTTRQAKRLFPLFATAGVVGGTLGNLATGPIAGVFGTQSLLLTQAALMAGSTALIFGLRRFIEAEQADSPAVTVIERLRGTVEAVRSSRLLVLAAAVAFLTWLLFYVVVFAFSETVAASFESESALAGFLGVFASAATVSTFLVGLFIAKRLFARIGIVMSLLILPVVYAAGFVIWLVEFDLFTASLVRGLQWVTLNAIGATAFTALFNVLTGARRAQVVAFMTAIPAQLGVIAGGLLLIASRRLSDASLFAIGLGIAVVGIGVVAAMRPAYVDAVVDAVRGGLTGVFEAPSLGFSALTDGEAVGVLKSHLSGERPSERAFALTTLAGLPDRDVLGDAADYMTDPSPEVRAAAFDALCVLDPAGYREHARIALDDESPDLRVRGLHYAGDMGLSETAIGALNDPDVRVRAVAAVVVGGEAGRAVQEEILDGSDPGAKAALLAEMLRQRRSADDVERFFTEADPKIRELAVRLAALGNLDAEPLRPRLDDRSLRVRRAAAEVLSETGRGRELLIEVLRSGTVNETDAALRAMTPFEVVDDRLADWALLEAERAGKLDRLARALADGSGPGGAYLQRVLSGRVHRLEQWVLMAMTTVGTRDVMSLVRKGLAAADAETRAEAMEALEAIGDGRVLRVLMPLLDSSGDAPDLEEREALRELSTDFDPWLRALALRSWAARIESDLEHLYGAAGSDPSDLVREIVPSLSLMPTERADTLGVIERVLALQKVRMLADLDPEDLELLARSTIERVFAAGESIFSEGDEGDEALIIVEGSADVTIDRGGERRPINTYGPGDTVGELALLRSGVRSADVTAGSDGVRVVMISRADLVSLLEERPTVALGMLATLADRLVEET